MRGEWRQCSELRLETGTAKVWGQPKPCRGTVQRSFSLESNTFRSVLYKDNEQQCTNRQERNEAWKLASQLEDCCGSNSKQEITAALAKRERGLQQACRLNKWVPSADGEWKGMESWREGELKNTRRLPDFYLWQHCGTIHGNEEPKRSGRWRKKNKFIATGAPSGGRELTKSKRKTQLSGHSPAKMINRWNWRVRLPVVKFSQSETESYTVHLQFYIF